MTPTISTVITNQQKLSKKFFKLLGGIREIKGQEDQVLEYIEQSLKISHEQVTQLLMERAHIYQLKAMTIRDTNGDSDSLKSALDGMSTTIDLMGKYINSNNQTQWLSRYFRYLGRYQDFVAFTKFETDKSAALILLNGATNSYNQAIKYFNLDPDFSEYPSRIYEYQAFIIHDSFFTRSVNNAWQESLALFSRMQTEKLALDLKAKDYYTWAVWITGISIRAIQNVIKLKQTEKYLNKIKDWIRETEKILVFPNGKTTWGDKNFSYRQAELDKIKHGIT